ncbi:RNase adapter RapZ [Clostridium botulinum]|uniref:RNase adapter RapZ n=1 Tax=Clostridium TaxID=1485 RepID=UPI000500552E|nr:MULTISPECIES: RNase adapter RapZ [unclassified Clostridium]AIY81574.1 P-loop ATPase family protein [Clostridium botulinum 202F]KAI3347415.1 RNase adapter RapZ [Clostridium botulinum]KFX57525.1 glmZ(sRNA)-inactivating NTPase [Clostridium botulinum]KFX59785.1 glmZ(sRNA)-inactivating NTPase [Clostridium botulinum]KON14180.1 glmZ(sRNA)-inactivating NTPase [Clostridium botulinum]
MRFVIVTGLSGAGKTQATRSLEDLGYFCVDNLPPKLINKFAELCSQSDGKIDKVALVIDIRGGVFFDDLFETLNYLKENEFKYEILFLDASDEVLIKRFKESRRSHPLSPDGRVLNGIIQERSKLREIKDRADIIIDTSKYAIRDLREKMNEHYGDNIESEKQLSITVLSFGFKYGIPVDSDLVFDVRFIPNPFYIPELKQYSGNDKSVKDYVLKQEETITFVEKLQDMLEYLVPNYIKEGKRQLIISIGCTGGRHRSVAIANEIYERLNKGNYKAKIEHRDVGEDLHRGEKKL